MSSNPDDPGGTAPVFGRSSLTPRSPPTSASKRPLCDVSPSHVSPDEKRLQRSSSSENVADVNRGPSMEVDPNVDYLEYVRESSECLAKINEIIIGQTSRIGVANKSTIMDMTQRITSLISMLAVKSASAERNLAIAERDLFKFKLETKNNPVVPVTKAGESYSDKLKLRLSKQTKPIQTREPMPCLVAYPTEERSAEFKTSEATKEALMKAIKPSDDGFQIVGVKKTAKSGVVLRVSNDAQVRKLQSVESIKSAGLKLEKPKGRRPRIIIKDIPDTMDDTKFLAALYNQNIKDEIKMSFSEYLKDIKIVRRRPVAYGRKWIGVELSPEIRKHLISTKEKIFIDFATCRFVDDIEVVRCLKCQQYGHVSKYCTENNPTCAHCAEAHDSRECAKKSEKDFKPICAPCRRLKKTADHKTGSESCPTYAARLEFNILNTTYE